MGARIEHKGPVRIEVEARGCSAIERIEVLRNNVLVAGYFHEGKWEVPSDDERTRWKVRLEVGWGPSPRDFPNPPPKEWEGEVAVEGGEVVSVEKCWRSRGQWVEPPGGPRCRFGLRTTAGLHHAPSIQGLIFEVEARPSDRISFAVNGKRLTMTLSEAARSSHVIYFPEEVKSRLKEVHGLDPASLPRPDPFYFLSHKARISRAVPEAGFKARFEFTDPSPPEGVNFYRVRVVQRNGQMAWSSPVWVVNG